MKLYDKHVATVTREGGKVRVEVLLLAGEVGERCRRCDLGRGVVCLRFGRV